MVTDDSLVGLEIKSDADTYVRLERQIKDYNLFFDYNYVVVGSTHAKHVNEHIPDSWGIISTELIDGNMDFYVLRELHEINASVLSVSLVYYGDLNLHIFRNEMNFQSINRKARILL